MNEKIKKIAMFLDVDGVLNQYNINERKRRNKIYKKSNYDINKKVFAPFNKKILRLYKLIKKYDIEVYLFSAWTKEELEYYLPNKFKLYFKEDTYKYISNMNKIAMNYENSLLIDDEASSIKEKGLKGEKCNIYKNIMMYQPDGNYGLIKKDFRNLEKILANKKNNYN